MVFHLLNEVEKFTHLGSMVTKDVGSDRNIAVRIGKARATSFHLSKFSMEVIIERLPLHIFNANVKLVFLYGSETRRTPTSRRIQSFVKKCLRKGLQIY